jgi:thioredoxin 1
MGEFLEIPESSFDIKVLQSRVPVIVEFGAPWCVPCKRIEPLLEDLSLNEWVGRVKLIKINVDESPDLTVKFSVMGVPTVILFVQGAPVAQFTGVQPKKRLMKRLNP